MDQSSIPESGISTALPLKDDSLTVASEAVRSQLVTLVTAAQEGPVRVVTPLGARGAHVAFIHICKDGRCSRTSFYVCCRTPSLKDRRE